MGERERNRHSLVYLNNSKELQCQAGNTAGQTARIFRETPGVNRIVYGLGTGKHSWRNLLATLTLKKSFALVHIKCRLSSLGHTHTHTRRHTHRDTQTQTQTWGHTDRWSPVCSRMATVLLSSVVVLQPNYTLHI